MGKIAKVSAGFHGRLIEAMEDADNMSQEELSSRIGFTPGHVSNVINQVSKPSHTFLVVTSVILNVSYRWLVEGKGPKRELNTYRVSEADLELLAEWHEMPAEVQAHLRAVVSQCARRCEESVDDKQRTAEAIENGKDGEN